MKGSTLRVSNGSAAINQRSREPKNIQATISTINTEKNPPSEGVKVEIQKNANISGPSNNGS